MPANELKFVEGLSEGKERGRGCYGAVYEVQVNGVPCIAKRLHDILVGRGGQEPVEAEQRAKVISKFKEECEILSDLRHPNVVQFMGVHYGRDEADISLIMEYMHMDLEQCMKAHPDIPLPYKTSILRDVAYGLVYLHSIPIIHRDLNAGNVLLTESLRAKIADLGVAKLFDREVAMRRTRTVCPGAPDFMSPESCGDSPKYDDKLDVFSFGHLTIYLVNQKAPYVLDKTVTKIDFNRQQVQVGKRRTALDQMGGPRHPLYTTVVQCLSDTPDQRPTSRDLVVKMKELCNLHSIPHKNILETLTELDQQRAEAEQQRAEAEALSINYFKMKESLDESDHVTNMKQLEIDKLKTKLNLSEAEAQIYKEDFEQERRDRERAREDLYTLQGRCTELEKENKKLSGSGNGELAAENERLRQQLAIAADHIQQQEEEFLASREEAAIASRREVEDAPEMEMEKERDKKTIEYLNKNHLNQVIVSYSGDTVLPTTVQHYRTTEEVVEQARERERANSCDQHNQEQVPQPDHTHAEVVQEYGGKSAVERDTLQNEERKSGAIENEDMREHRFTQSQDQSATLPRGRANPPPVQPRKPRPVFEVLLPTMCYGNSQHYSTLSRHSQASDSPSERQFTKGEMSEKQVNENGRANEESMMPFEEKGIEDAEERKRNHSVHSQSSQDPPLVLPAAGIDSQQLRNSSILPHQSQASDNPFTCSERQFAREGMSEKQVNENGIANEESMMPFGEKRREDAEERKTNEELRNHSVHSQSSQDSPSEVVCAPQPDHTHTTALQECEGDTSQNEESDIESEDTREHRSLPPVQPRKPRPRQVLPATADHPFTCSERQIDREEMLGTRNENGRVHEDPFKERAVEDKRTIQELRNHMALTNERGRTAPPIKPRKQQQQSTARQRSITDADEALLPAAAGSRLRTNTLPTCRTRILPPGQPQQPFIPPTVEDLQSSRLRRSAVLHSPPQPFIPTAEVLQVPQLRRAATVRNTVQRPPEPTAGANNELAAKLLARRSKFEDS